MGLLPRPARVLGGSILFADPDKPGTITDIVRLAPDGREMRALRGGRISIVFQEPMTAMSPLHTIGDQVGEALRLHRDASASEARELTRDMLRLVGFPDRSEEHTSELQSLMRISYAVFCLKKKKQQQSNKQQNPPP